MLITAVTGIQKIPTFRGKNIDTQRIPTFSNTFLSLTKGFCSKGWNSLSISHSSYQHFNFLPYLSLSTQYSIFITWRAAAQ